MILPLKTEHQIVDLIEDLVWKHPGISTNQLWARVKSKTYHCLVIDFEKTLGGLLKLGHLQCMGKRWWIVDPQNYQKRVYPNASTK